MTSFKIKLLVLGKALLDFSSTVQDCEVHTGRHPTSGTGYILDGHITHPPWTEELNFVPPQQHQGNIPNPKSALKF